MAAGSAAAFFSSLPDRAARCSARHYKRNMAAMTDKIFPFGYSAECRGVSQRLMQVEKSAKTQKRA